MRSIAFSTLLLTLAPCLPTIGATVFTSEASFLGSAGAVSLESFETLPATDPFPGVELVASEHVMITTSPAGADLDIWGHSASAAHATHGDKYLVWYGQTSSASLTFAFPAPLIALGVSIVDYGYPANGTPLTFSTNAGESGVAAVGIEDIDNEQFFGFKGLPFTSITFSRGSMADGIGFDEMYFRALPEPGAGTLSGIALLSLAALRRRK